MELGTEFGQWGVGWMYGSSWRREICFRPSRNLSVSQSVYQSVSVHHHIHHHSVHHHIHHHATSRSWSGTSWRGQAACGSLLGEVRRRRAVQEEDKKRQSILLPARGTTYISPVSRTIRRTHRRRRRGGGGGTVPPQKKFWKRKIRAKAVGNSGKSDGTFGQKQSWEIWRKKVIENSGKSNGNFRKKQWEIRAKGIIFARNICLRFPSFLIAFAQIFPLFLPEFQMLLPEFPNAFSRNSGKSNGEICSKAMRKLGN